MSYSILSVTDRKVGSYVFVVTLFYYVFTVSTILIICFFNSQWSLPKTYKFFHFLLLV